MRRDETFTAHDHTVIEVELRSGSILVRAGTSGRVDVSIDSSTADHVDVGQVGDRISIRAARRGRSGKIAVDVPVGTDVHVKGASVEVAGRGALGTLRVRSASSDVTADDVVRADVVLASGDVRIDLVRDSGHITTTSGDVRLHSVGGRLNVTLGSGDLEVDTVAGDVEAESASGDLTVRRFDGTSVNMRTISGDLRLGLPRGIRVEPEISTMSGTIKLPQASAPSASDSATADRRSVRVRLRSVSGDIRVERAD